MSRRMGGWTGTASSARPNGTPIRLTRKNCRFWQCCTRSRCRRKKAARCLPTCALPAAMKDRLAGLVGLHGRSSGPAGERLYGADKGETERHYGEVPRPAVINHPVTKRPILFVNPMHTHGFQGMARDEAWPLIEELAAFATQERFTYYHSWRPGDLLMWDERATMHRGAGDADPQERRVMMRTIVYPN